MANTTTPGRGKLETSELASKVERLELEIRHLEAKARFEQLKAQHGVGPKGKGKPA